MAALQKDAPPEQLVMLLSSMERFVFVIGRLCRRRSDTGDKQFWVFRQICGSDSSLIGDVGA